MAYGETISMQKIRKDLLGDITRLTHERDEALKRAEEAERRLEFAVAFHVDNRIAINKIADTGDGYVWQAIDVDIIDPLFNTTLFYTQTLNDMFNELDGVTQ